MRLTAAIDRTAASTVGTMIHFQLRSSAWPSRRKSRSPESGAANGLWLADAGFETAFWTAILSMPARLLPARQNAQRIAHSANATTTQPGRLHSIKVAAGLIQPLACRKRWHVAGIVTLC